MVKELNYTLLLMSAAFILNACDFKDKNSSTKAAEDSTNKALAALTNDSTAKSSKLLTKIEFAEASFDFGKIEEGKKVSHVFKFTNTGSNPLVLESVRPSCGCTTPEYTKDTIAPGKEGKINVTYDSNGRNGQINKTIDVLANTEPASTVLKISAFVKEKKSGPYKQ